MSTPSRNLRSTAARRQAQLNSQQQNTASTTAAPSPPPSTMEPPAPPRTRATTRSQTQARSSHTTSGALQRHRRTQPCARRPPPSNQPLTRIAENSAAAPDSSQVPITQQPSTGATPNTAAAPAGPRHDPGEPVQDQSRPADWIPPSRRAANTPYPIGEQYSTRQQTQNQDSIIGRRIHSALITPADDAGEGTVAEQLAQPRPARGPPRLLNIVPAAPANGFMTGRRLGGRRQAISTADRTEEPHGGFEQYSLDENEMALLHPLVRRGRAALRRRARNRSSDSDSDSEHLTDQQREELRTQRRQQIQADYERSQATLRARREQEYVALQARARTFTLTSSTTPSALNATVLEGQKATRKLSQLAENACPICTDELTEPTTTKCGHVFCKACVVQWMLEKGTCPTCRQRHRVEELVGIVTEREEESRANNAAIMRALDDMRAAGAEVIIMPGEVVDEEEL